MSLLPVAMLLALSAPGAGEPDPEIEDAVRVLNQARIGTDGAALLAFVRSQTPVAEDQARMAGAVRRLGDESFEVRESASRDLIAAGRLALPFLRSAVQDPDIEVMHRARICLEQINVPSLKSQLSAAARLLADRKPTGAVQVLLAYLPFADDEDVEEVALASLAVVGLKAPDRPHEAVLAAATDTRPLRRAAAAHVLGYVSPTSGRTPLTRLVTDEDARVRYEASVALLRQGERSAGRVLIALLTEASAQLNVRVENTLWTLAGDKAPELSGSAAVGDRLKAREIWEKWWKSQGDQVDVKSLSEASPLLGLTLVCEYDGVQGGGRLAEYGRDGKMRWQISNLSGINDAQLLPGGRVLIAERNAISHGVTERDRTGKILWSCAAPGAIACQRLANGNTLIATFSEMFEVTPNQERVHALPGNFRHAIRIRNGHILAINASGQIVDLDADWKEVRKVSPALYGSGAGYWASVEPLPSGRLLVALGGSGKVVEMDWTGKIEWECDQPNCVCATRLRNGHTLISGFEQRALFEVDREGKEVAKTQLQGRPFTVRRY